MSLSFKQIAVVGLGWLAVGEVVTVLYDGETPARTYRKLRNERSRKSERLLGVAVSHFIASAAWPAFIYFQERQKRLRAKKS